MKATGRCPKCSCARLYVVHHVSQPAHHCINAVAPLSVTCAEVPSADVGGTDGNEYRADIGRFDAWVCSACGLTEWYAQGFAPAFDALAKQGRHVRVVERPTNEPYR